VRIELNLIITTITKLQRKLVRIVRRYRL